jgi:hypothetical protein
MTGAPPPGPGRADDGASRGDGAAAAPLTGRDLGSIFNNDINNILHASAGDAITVAQYSGAVHAILDHRPGLLAQNVGLPDPVIYPSAVATGWERYHAEISRELWPEQDAVVAGRQAAALRRLAALGTDPLQLTIAACRQRQVPVVASYRMNAEDFYHASYRLSDFGRAHAAARIAGAGCLDPAVPAVFDHYVAVIAEVLDRYDVDGVELDFRRWYHLVSDPRRNHGVLTRLVRAVRQHADAVGAARGGRLLVGARVGPSLDLDPTPFVYPGIFYAEKPTNASCRDLGLDVSAWVREGLVDYLCPTLFLDGLPAQPRTAQFVALTAGTPVGVYPTLWGWSAWMHGIGERSIGLEAADAGALALFKDDLCTAALRLYEEGADGISTYNWYAHLRHARLPHAWAAAFPGAGADRLLAWVHPLLPDRQALRRYRAAPWPWPADWQPTPR